MAKMLIGTDRAAQYGNAADTHRRIAKMWEQVLGDDVRELDECDVALMMVCVKIIRAVKNPEYADSWIDIAGYAALGCEMATVHNDEDEEAQL